MITDPSIVLLDEPTSGLDSFMAKKICKTLQSLAHNDGKTIIATIHQPSSAAFYYFDRLLLMADGNIVYQGLANRAPRYFDQIGYNVGKFANPADIFMRIISVNYPKMDEDEEKLNNLITSYKKKCEPAVIKHMTEISLIEFKPRMDNFAEPNFSKQLGLLLGRQKTYLARQPLISIAQIGIAIVQALFALSLFYNINGFHKQQIQNTVGSIFFLAANVFVGIIYGAIMSFQLERDVLLRELASKCYGLPAYFVSKNLFEIPLMILFPLFTQLIVYWGASYTFFDGDTRIKGDQYTFWKFYFLLFLVSQCAIGYGYCVSAACKNQVDSSNLSNVVTLPSIFFGGLFTNGTTMVKGVGWIQYLSPIRYAFEGMLYAEYEETILKGVLVQYNLNMGYWNCIIGLAVLSVATRIASLAILKMNVKYVA